jgi:hypothetical protein
MVYSVEQKDFPTPETRGLQNKEFWDGLHSFFEVTIEMVKDLGPESGIKLNAADEELKEFPREFGGSRSLVFLRLPRTGF